MYKFLLILLSVVSMATTTFAQQKQDMDNKQSNQKVLVAYFSATGTTADAAKKLTKVTGGELYAITPVKHYTSDDLNWHNKQSRSSIEMNDSKSRPAIKGKKENIADYDVVFIGYPIWWDLVPRIINTFIESHNLKGKVIIPFATSGGSSITNSMATLKRTYPDLNWETGKLLNRMSDEAIHEWIDKLEF